MLRPPAAPVADVNMRRNSSSECTVRISSTEKPGCRTTDWDERCNNQMKGKEKR